jgi:hypothetical protein
MKSQNQLLVWIIFQLNLNLIAFLSKSVQKREGAKHREQQMFNCHSEINYLVSASPGTKRSIGQRSDARFFFKSDLKKINLLIAGYTR